MRMIDPTYLRNIHDGLILGTLHKDNASVLPMGLVGMYEEALPPASNVNERKKFLAFFSVLALLRKEVSVEFLMSLLEGWSEEAIIYYLNKYSKWFNSPQGGKYVLYHERLRAFILQKISKEQFNTCNETIIKVSHDALSRRSGDEWERYALENLSKHLLIIAMESKDATVLKALAYNTTHWNRQVEISKGFEWSKHMLNNMMLWASKYDDEEVIECALNKVDLHHQEQNDAPRIVELVTQNDIETALDRIDKFGGQDKEGLQRKFILYMLCLMELTLLDSKDKPFRKEAIEKLLKHFDDNIPNDHSLLNWNDFFPSYLIFQITCELTELSLNILNIYKRNDLFKNFDLEKEINFKYSETKISKQFQVKINYVSLKKTSYSILELENLTRQFDVHIDLIQSPWDISNDYLEYGLKFLVGNDLKTGLIFIEIAILYIDLIEGDDYNDDRSQAKWRMSLDLAKIGFNKLALDVMPEKNTDYYDWACRDLSELFEIQKDEDSLYMLLKISNFEKHPLKTILNHLAFVLDYKNLKRIYFEYLSSNNSYLVADNIIKDLSLVLISQKRFDPVYFIVNNKLIQFRDLDGVICELISAEIIQNNTENSYRLLDKITAQSYKASSINQHILSFLNEKNLDYLILNSSWNEDWNRESYLDNLFENISEKFNINTAENKLNLLGNNSEKDSALLGIVRYCCKVGNQEKGFKHYNEIKNIYKKEAAIHHLIRFSNKNYDFLNLLINDASNNLNTTLKYKLLLKFYQELLLISEKIIIDKLFILVLETARSIDNQENKLYELVSLSSYLIKQGMQMEAIEILKETQSAARNFEDYETKNKLLSKICFEFSELDLFDISLKTAYEISDNYWQSISLIDLYQKLFRKGKRQKFEIVMNSALNSARKISNEFNLFSVLMKIYRILKNSGEIEFANVVLEESIGRAINLSDFKIKSCTLIDITFILYQNRDLSKIEILMKEAFEATIRIIDQVDRNTNFQKFTDIALKVGIPSLIELIPVSSIRNKALLEISNDNIKSFGYFKSLKNTKQFKIYENKQLFKNGLIKSLNATNINTSIAIHAIIDNQNGSESIEHILQMYALNLIFFGELTEEKIIRFNRPLNIQWAIDIKNSTIIN
jgi:hypothetical protein